MVAKGPTLCLPPMPLSSDLHGMESRYVTAQLAEVAHVEPAAVAPLLREADVLASWALETGTEA
jgi:hypothetical protein